MMIYDENRSNSEIELHLDDKTIFPYNCNLLNEFSIYKRKKKYFITLHELLNIENVEEIPEELILENVFWLFLGVKTNFFEEYLEKNFVISGLSRTCTFNLLKKIVHIGHQISKLYEFVLPYLDYHVSYILDNSSFILTSYKNCLQQFLTFKLEKLFIKFTKSYWNDSNSYSNSLINFLNFLNSDNCDYLLDQIDFFYNINLNLEKFTNANHLLTLKLLDEFYKHISISISNETILITFLCCFKHVLKYIENFLRNGYPIDPKKEFFFELSKFNLNDNYWHTCLIIRDDFQIPKCLEKNWNLILNGIKSKLVLNYLNIKIDLDPCDLYKSFLNCFFVNLNNKQEFECKEGNISNLENDSKIDFNSDLESNEYKFFKENHLSTHKKIFNWIKDELKDTSLVNVNKLQEPIYEHDLKNFSLPIELNKKFKIVHNHFEQCLEKILDNLILPICNKATEYFKSCSKQHCKIYNDYYLMQVESHHLSIYLNLLFENLIKDPIKFQDGLYRNEYDLEKIDEFKNVNLKAYLDFTQVFKDENVYLDILSRFHFLYNDLDWVSSMLLNNEVREFYDEIFRFLLNLKFLKWLSENLPLTNRKLAKQKHKSLKYYYLFHKLFLAKRSLLIIIEAIHSKLMLKINYIIKCFYIDLENAYNYETIINSFNNFQNEIKRCLHLNESKNEQNFLFSYKSFIYKLCNHAINIWKLWFSIEKLLDDNYDQENTYNRFSTIVNNKLEIVFFDLNTDLNPIVKQLDEINDFLLENSKIIIC